MRNAKALGVLARSYASISHHTKRGVKQGNTLNLLVVDAGSEYAMSNWNAAGIFVFNIAGFIVVHPRMRGGQYRGTALRETRRNKERTYPELLQDRCCRLVVFEIEGGGRWSDEAR